MPRCGAPLTNSGRSSRCAVLLTVVAAASSQAVPAWAESSRPPWASFYRLCTSQQQSLEYLASSLQKAGWSREGWGANASEIMRHVAFLTFFPSHPTTSQPVSELMKTLDQLYAPDRIPLYGIAFGDPVSGDRAYAYVNDDKLICALASKERRIDDIFAEIDQPAPKAWGLTRYGIYRPDGIYRMVNEIVPDAEALIPPDLPFRTSFNVSVSQKPEKSK